MNWIDAIIILTFLIYIVEGLRRGFIEQLLELAGFFLTIFISIWIYRPFGSWLADHIHLQRVVAEPIAFLALWLILQAVYGLILRLVYPLVPVGWRNNWPNKIAGVVPALVRAYIIVAVLVTMIAILGTPQLREWVDSSFLGSRFVAQSSAVEASLNKLFGRDVKNSLTFLTVTPQNEQIIEPDERVDLKFTTTDVTVDQASETKMLELLNSERVKVGLQPLVMDEKLREVARAHSKDMFARGYFSHVDLDGKSPFDRMSAAGILFRAAGENLAYAANVTLAHDGLMRSPGHRANILDPHFGHVGIGVIDGGIYGKMFTQDFRD